MRISKAKAIELKQALVALRDETSLIERELALATGAIKRETVNWVPMWVDWENAMRSDRVGATAMRAISDAGELMWYVRHDRKKHGFHSQRGTPAEAIAEAEDAWERRRQVRGQWADIEKVRKELLLGRRRMFVRVQDAHDSPLCSIGIAWFLKRMGLSRVEGVSGRTAALLMKIEPQMGFVIHQAVLREAAADSMPDPVATPARAV